MRENHMSLRDYRGAILEVRKQMEASCSQLQDRMEASRRLRPVGSADDPLFLELMKLYQSIGAAWKLAEEMADDSLLRICKEGKYAEEGEDE